MQEELSRTRLLIGETALQKLNDARVAVFGVGGVGGYVCEALVRSGVGHFDLIDNDDVSRSNINRQIIATQSNIGQSKVKVMKERMLDINPDVCVNIYPRFFLPENAKEFPFESFDYIVDAIDTVTGKIELVKIAERLNIPIISAMGAGNKLDPSGFKVADIYKTKVCPLAKVMRRELKKQGIKKLKVVYSEEEPVVLNNFMKDKQEAEQKQDNTFGSKRRSIPGSTAFTPGVCGLIIASEVVKDLIVTVQP